MGQELGAVELGGGKKYLTWKEYLEKVGDPKSYTGTHAVIRIWPPAKYPSATLVFWVDDPAHPDGGYGVRKSIPPQMWAALEKAGFVPGKARKGGTLYLDFQGGLMKLILEEDSGVYAPDKSGGWELV